MKNAIKEKIQYLWLDGVVMDCRFCKNYDPTGRNGGYCNLLTVPVKGKWDACRCFSSSFPENSLQNNTTD
jgi:hypothetical protein